MDIGGFCVENRYRTGQLIYDKTGVENDDLKEWRELNARWYQFGTFTPLYRAHGQFPLREIYNIAPEDHPAYQTILYYNQLRYRLMPYIYSLAGKTYFDDYTIMRPLVMDYASDLAVRDNSTQYMFGPSMMIAPVYTYKATSREVYFPTQRIGMIYIRVNVIKVAKSRRLRLHSNVCRYLLRQVVSYYMVRRSLM